MKKDRWISKVRYHEFPQHVRRRSCVEGVQEEDPSDEESGEIRECHLHSASGIVHVLGVPWILVPGGIVVVPLDDTRSVHGPLVIRCKLKGRGGPNGRGVR